MGPHGETILTAHRGQSFDLDANDFAEGNAAMAAAALDLLAALKDCRTNVAGYNIRSRDDYETVLADFWKEIQRTDAIARAAIAKATGVP